MVTHTSPEHNDPDSASVIRGLYQTLRQDRGEIRLLELHPADQLDHPLSGTLRHVKLQSASFSALSYVWGDQKNDKSEILIKYDGSARKYVAAKLRGKSISSSYMHPISSSLARSLRHLRKRHDVVTIWTDFLCINQGDEPEKNWQVPLMKSIYIQASEVHAWLGPRYNDDAGFIRNINTAFDVAQRIWNIAEQIPNSPNAVSEIDWLPACFQVAHRNPSTDPKQRVWIHFVSALRNAASANPAIMSNIQCFSLLSRNDYFSRMWILQETGRARRLTFHFGLKRLSHRPLLLALALAESLRDPKDEAQNARLLERADMRFLGCLSARSTCMQKVAIHEVLSAAYYEPGRAYKASNPRDLIYARLGLAENSDAIKVKYEQSVTDVFVDASRVLLTEGVLDILTTFRPYQYQKDQSGEYLPSWAYDWRRKTRDVFVDYHASLGSSQQVTITPYHGGKFKHVLYMTGIEIGKIAYTGEKYSTVVCAAGLHKGTIALGSLRAVSEEMTGERRETLKHNIQVTYTRLGDEISDADVDKLFSYRSLPFASFWCWWVLWIANLVEMMKAAERLRSNFQLTDINVSELLFRLGANVMGNSKDMQHLGTRTSILAFIDYRRWSSLLAASSAQGSSDENFVSEMAGLLFLSPWGMRPAVLGNGWFGYVPEDTKLEDRIVIFHGVKAPLVLRQATKDAYRIVGPAHICGVMQGEFLRYNHPVQSFGIV